MRKPTYLVGEVHSDAGGASLDLPHGLSQRLHAGLQLSSIPRQPRRPLLQPAHLLLQSLQLGPQSSQLTPPSLQHQLDALTLEHKVGHGVEETVSETLSLYGGEWCFQYSTVLNMRIKQIFTNKHSTKKVFY